MDKLFQYKIIDNIIQISMMDGNTLYMPICNNWIDEFFTVYYQVYIKDQYRTNRIKKDDVVIDCGAHIGTFSLLACQHGARCVYAFEPFRNNITALERLMYLGNPINIIPSVVFNINGILKFEPKEGRGSGGGKVAQEGHDVTAFRIDDVVNEFKIDKVNFIKMDVEGSELKALEGAIDTIYNYKPSLAIAAYHNEEDPRILREFILDIDSNYEIEISSKDIFCETVLNATYKGD